MGTAPVVEVRTFAKRKVTDAELEEALAYASQSRPEVRYVRGKKKGTIKRKAYVGVALSHEMLRLIGDTALKRWSEQPKAKLPMIAAYAARSLIHKYRTESAETTQHRYEGYKCATMKMMNIRRMWQMEKDKEREARSEVIPERPKQTEPVLDENPKHKNQYRLFS